jgi:predicted nucleotidyltransferase
MTKEPFPSLDLLPAVFRKYNGIKAVYLFGSAASGNLRSDSDLDIGIVPADDSIHDKKLELLSDLAYVGFCNVDIVFLDVQDIVLRFEIVKRNKVIYRTDDFDSGEMFSLTLRQYTDFLPYLKVQREALKKRLSNG